MRIWKSSLLIIGLSVLVLSSITVSAETVTDPTGDVYYGSGIAYNLATDDKPNIDITGITFDEGTVTTTMTMTVNGVIEVSEYAMYWVTYAVGEEASYVFTYVNGEVFGIATTGESGSFDASASVSGNTLTVELDSINIANGDGALYGYASIWLEGADDSGEVWMDYAPGEYSPWYGVGDDTGGDVTGGDDTGGDDTGGDDTGTDAPTGTPGFETLAVIAALGIAFIVLKRKK